MTYESESECATHYTTAPHNEWHKQPKSLRGVQLELPVGPLQQYSKP